MGSTEANPQHKLLSGTKTSDKVENTTLRHAPTTKIETIGDLDETTATENTAVTNGGIPKPSSSTSTTIANSSPGSNEEHRQMWEEVALRYQQILHREYRMLNLPSYPVEGGNVYLYYVPVIVNQGPTAQTDSGVNIECNNKTTADHETSENNEDVIYINDSDEDCGVKVEPPAEFVQTVHESSYGKHIKVEDNNNLFPISCKWEKNQHDDYGSSSSKLEENTIKVGEGFDYSNSYIEHEQHTKNSSDKRDGSKMSDDEENMLDQTHCNDNNIQIREDYIRIFKGYTIEYHPLRRDNAVKQRHRAPGSQQCRKRDEKIQDLKKRLAEHKVELEKLKFQQSVEEMFL
ncbi:hypothetical protein OS493_015278 [Desmophyllum pertusum]|uniref:Uncharacterized protein n=1 Tax=Desmophyllum pertusum TaxID=174260 RepID=A0A9W9ZGC8_9CNID|nr:hypothetical protein OS493_015278 [Desmophyllum pertusum]